MTVRESIQNEIYALEDAKRSMEDLLAKLANDDLDDFGDSPYDYDGHIFYETRDHMAALRNVVIPGLDELLVGRKDDLRTFPETILNMDLVKMNNRWN